MEKRQRITFDIQRECGWFKEEKKRKIIILKKKEEFKVICSKNCEKCMDLMWMKWTAVPWIVSMRQVNTYMYIGNR